MFVGGCDTCWEGGITLAISKYSSHSGAAACPLRSSTILRSLNLASPLFPCTSWGWVNIPGSAHCVTERTCDQVIKQAACVCASHKLQKLFFRLAVVQTHFKAGTTSIFLELLVGNLSIVLPDSVLSQQSTPWGEMGQTSKSGVMQEDKSNRRLLLHSMWLRSNEQSRVGKAVAFIGSW